MATITKSPSRARMPRRRIPSTVSLSATSSRRVRELTARASRQADQLRLLTPLYMRIERLLAPNGIKRLQDAPGIPTTHKEAGVLLYALNQEMLTLINKLADSVAVLQVQLDEVPPASTTVV